MSHFTEFVGFKDSSGAAIRGHETSMTFAASQTFFTFG
jgi:hypothetical protein